MANPNKSQIQYLNNQADKAYDRGDITMGDLLTYRAEELEAGLDNG